MQIYTVCWFGWDEDANGNHTMRNEFKASALGWDTTTIFDACIEDRSRKRIRRRFQSDWSLPFLHKCSQIPHFE
jgi:hypothetical protein